MADNEKNLNKEEESTKGNSNGGESQDGKGNSVPNGEKKQDEKKKKEGTLVKLIKQILVYGGLWILWVILLWLIIFPLSQFLGLENFYFLGKQNILLSVKGIIFGVIIVWSIYSSWSQVPERYIWLVELFEEYVAKWSSGLKFPFPFFGFISIKEIYVGEYVMSLFMQDNCPGEYGYGDVEFKDVSAPIKATLYFRIEDPYKAVYNVEGSLFRAIEDKIDSAIRSFWGKHTVERANELRGRATLPYILSGKEPPGPDKQPQPLSEEEMKRELNASVLYNEIRNNWGVEITGLAISDIVLSTEQKEIRREVLRAQKEAEAADHYKEATIIKAKGEQKATIIKANGERGKYVLEGRGVTKQIDQLKETGLSAQESSLYLAERLKWNTSSETRTTVIETSGERSTVASGVGFGVGYNAAQQESPAPKDSETQKEPSQETAYKGGEEE